MNKLAVLLVCVCSVASIRLVSAVRYNHDQASAEWQAFKAKHGKIYENNQIDALRMHIYSQHKLRVEEFNKKSAAEAGFTLGVNHMSDWTQAEKKQLNGFKLPESPRLTNSLGSQKFLENILADNSIGVPDELDWRKTPGRVSRVKDQGSKCGSCWTFSATGALEGQERLRRLANGSVASDLVELSEQNLVDCVKQDKGCNGGVMSDAFDYAQQGIDDEASYPYEAVDGECRFQRNRVAFQDSGTANLPTNDEQKLKEVVAKFGPVSVAIAANEHFQSYEGGVYYDTNCGNTTRDLDHAVLVVGYGRDPKRGDYWLVKNSWGANWGEDGYVRMARNRNNHCGIATMAMIPTF